MNEKARIVTVAKASVADEKVERRMCGPTKGDQPNRGHVV